MSITHNKRRVSVKGGRPQSVGWKSRVKQGSGGLRGRVGGEGEGKGEGEGEGEGRRRERGERGEGERERGRGKKGEGGGELGLKRMKGTRRGVRRRGEL
ncbi:unnamed protein product [Closterium sp. Naga37s-1]|nr:unnamed protein product [Closterium sp. Naga37s-1]